MGLKVWFANCGVASVVEMDWWQEETHSSGLRIGFTPAQVRVLNLLFLGPVLSVWKHCWCMQHRVLGEPVLGTHASQKRPTFRGEDVVLLTTFTKLTNIMLWMQ